MYTNKGLSYICKVLSELDPRNMIREELSKVLCPYAGLQEIKREPQVEELLVNASSIFLDESVITGQSLLILFSEWLDNGPFRQKCLSNKKLIRKGSAILEVYPHECVELPALQIIYEGVDWFPSDLSDEILNRSRNIASKEVTKRLNRLFKEEVSN